MTTKIMPEESVNLNDLLDKNYEIGFLDAILQVSQFLENIVPQDIRRQVLEMKSQRKDVKND